MLITSKAEEQPLTEHNAMQNARDGKRVDQMGNTTHLNSSKRHLTILSPIRFLQLKVEIFNLTAVGNRPGYDNVFIRFRYEESRRRWFSELHIEQLPIAERQLARGKFPDDELLTREADRGFGRVRGSVRPRRPGRGKFRTIWIRICRAVFES